MAESYPKGGDEGARASNRCRCGIPDGNVTQEDLDQFIVDAQWQTEIVKPGPRFTMPQSKKRSRKSAAEAPNKKRKVQEILQGGEEQLDKGQLYLSQKVLVRGATGRNNGSINRLEDKATSYTMRPKSINGVEKPARLPSTIERGSHLSDS